MRFDGFAHLLAHWAAETPTACALRYGPRRWSYAQLREAAEERAAALRRGGGTCIGVLCGGGFDCVLTVLAANLAGMQVVMLDDSAPEDTLRTLIAYTDVDTLWGDPELTEALSDALTGGVTEGAGQLLFFTSGTTEQAKAVVLTDRSLCQSAWNGASMLPLRPSDTLLCMLPLHHVFGFVCGLLWGLACGACVALGRGVRHYADDCAFYRPTALPAVPLLLDFLLKTSAINPELRLVLVGAGDCPPSLLDAAAGRGLAVSFGYGLTETSSGVAISVSGDPYAMSVCPDDTVTPAEDGELLITAPTCMMRGYYKRPADTAAALRGGVLHTGDLGYLDEAGKLHVTGRKKELLALPDGTKIFLPEYEGRLMAALGHTELAVTLRDGWPVLVYSGPAEEAALRRRLQTLMAALPRGQQLRGVYIINEPLPRTAAGKIQRWALQQKVSSL